MEEVYRTRQKRPTEEILQYSKNGGVEIPKDVYDKIIEAYIIVSLSRISAKAVAVVATSVT